ncbi:MAG: RNA-binding cell elongation regulator Jag/EloR [Oscillospiraceae bacterium]
MIREAIAKAATVDEAMEKAAVELGVTQSDCKFEVLEAPKRSLFGKNKEAVVKATIEVEEPVTSKSGLSPVNSNKLAIATQYLQNILNSMGLSTISMEIVEKEDGAVITFNGDGMAALIGHHGETLDALQYLIALTCNRIDGDYYRITLDCGNYREKREVTLQGLAARIASKVKKTGRSQLLEPMNPYERRIIHAIVSDIEGVYSKSKGEEPNRRVVILSDTPAKVTFNKNTNRKEDFNNAPKNDFKDRKPYVHKPERTMEEILKEDFKEKEKSAELYSKVEL